jgi:uncharacterized protein YndB with AHSA1/START domain
MENLVRMQLKLNVTPEQAMAALVSADALKQWFSEFAAVALDTKTYDFWGRFTPGAPATQSDGHHPLTDYTAQRQLAYDWNVKDAQTNVLFKLLRRDDHTILTLRHRGASDGSHSWSEWTLEDFWFLSLENLRRHLDGKPAEARIDFSANMNGDIRHETEVDAPASKVFDVLIRPEQLERWIASRSTVEPKIGGIFDLGWTGVPAAKILDIVPDKKLALSSTDRDGDQPVDTVISWTLEENNGKTRVTFVHSGFRPDKPNGGIKAGWRNFLNFVRSIAEYGDNWQPPISVVAPEMVPYYNAAIGKGQAEIVPELKELEPTP